MTIFVVPVEPLYLLICISPRSRLIIAPHYFKELLKCHMRLRLHMSSFPLQHRLQISLFSLQTTKNLLELEGQFSSYSDKKPTPLFIIFSV